MTAKIKRAHVAAAVEQAGFVQMHSDGLKESVRCAERRVPKIKIATPKAAITLNQVSRRID